LGITDLSQRVLLTALGHVRRDYKSFLTERVVSR